MFSSLFYPGLSPKIEPGSLIPWAPKAPSVAATGGGYRIGFDDVLYMIPRVGPSRPFLLINTLPPDDQDFLIKGTLACHIEESTINAILDDFRIDLGKYLIVVYGRHCADATVDRKREQLVKLGFKRVFVYYGGMFEWCLLQDVYGEDVFLVNDVTKKKDLLHFAPAKLWE